MAKPVKKQPAVAKAKPVKRTLLENLEQKLAGNQTAVLIITLALSLLFALLMFDVKISSGNDDSMYIEGGYNFSKDLTHAFTANAPFYPLLLSLPIKFFGINLILLKSISVVFTLLHLYILFLAFRNRIPFTVLVPVMLILAVNSFIAFFASLTFTEAFYMFLQALFIYIFFRALDRTRGNNSIKDTWKYWIMLGVGLFLLNFCKNIAVGAAGAVIVMLAIEKRWMHILYAIGGMLIIRIPTELARKAIWGGDQFEAQLALLMQIDPYNADKGMEDVSGFIQRFLDNTGLYIGKRLYQILGFIDINSTEVKSGLILITIVLFAIALVNLLRRKNEYAMFSLVFSVCLMGLTFLILQKQWDQPRYIMVYLPYILIVMFYAIYSLVIKQGSGIQWLYIGFFCLLFFSSLFSSVSKAAENFPKLKKNLSGDIYYGYTEDWVNYLKMSSYCADSLPPNTKAAARKAPMSFIYADGKQFYPVYNVFSEDPDTVLNTFKENGVTHVILASLRRNPNVADGYIINTMNRLMQPVAQKYPDKLKLVKQIGESEPAYLYEIKY